MNGKIVIITGGAQGIGKATAERFCKEGASVVIWDINEEKGKECVIQFKNIGFNLLFQKVDTTDYTTVVNAASEVINIYKKIDVLINCASIISNAVDSKLTIDQWQKTIDINLTGVFNCTKVIGPLMVKNKYGRIINTSSLMGMYGDNDQINYSATNSGIIGITRVWSRELGKQGITVNIVTPGFIASDNHENPNPTSLKSIKDKIPVGRLGLPDDIANAYLFLAAESSSFINGAVLNVDGGYAA